MFVPETVSKLEQILSDYVDVDDKANSVFKTDDGEEVAPGFAKKQNSLFDTLMGSGILD